MINSARFCFLEHGGFYARILLQQSTDSKLFEHRLVQFLLSHLVVEREITYS